MAPRQEIFTKVSVPWASRASHLLVKYVDKPRATRRTRMACYCGVRVKEDEGESHVKGRPLDLDWETSVLYICPSSLNHDAALSQGGCSGQS